MSQLTRVVGRGRMHSAVSGAMAALSATPRLQQARCRRPRRECDAGATHRRGHDGRERRRRRGLRVSSLARRRAPPSLLRANLRPGKLQAILQLLECRIITRAGSLARPAAPPCRCCGRRRSGRSLAVYSGVYVLVGRTSGLSTKLTKKMSRGGNESVPAAAPSTRSARGRLSVTGPVRQGLGPDAGPALGDAP